MLPFSIVKNIAEELDALPDDWTGYVNRNTGEVYSVSNADVSILEEDCDTDLFPQWQRDELPKIREVLEDDAWVTLPSKFDVHEWATMNDFSLSIVEEELRDELLHCIRGKGAFRFFKKTIGRHGIVDQWLHFKKEALKRIVSNWLDAHDIIYSRDENASTPE